MDNNKVLSSRLENDEPGTFFAVNRELFLTVEPSLMETIMIHKISPNPSLPKRGIKKTT
ncbi:hypothetical protein M1N66_02105 [Thermodesulfovibrionales bacterium]|nr:hypothetical protein [Thermodesulfovibrionales bacterium]